MINVVTLSANLSRLVDYIAAKFQLWLLWPMGRFFITPLRAIFYCAKVVILGLRNAALVHSGDQQSVDAAMLFVASKAPQNDALFLLSMAKCLAEASGTDVLNLIIRANNGAPIKQIPQLVRLSGMHINIRVLINTPDPDHEMLQRTFFTSDTISGLEQTASASFQTLFNDFLREDRAKRFRVPLVYRNDAHKYCKTIDPYAAICFIAISPPMLYATVFDHLHKIFAAHSNWHFLIASTDAHLGENAHKWAQNVTPLTSFSIPLLTQVALINESDVFIGGEDIFGIYAADQGVNAHLFVSKNVPDVANKNLTLLVFDQIKLETEFQRITIEALSRSKLRT